MYLAMNRFSILKGQEEAFETVWRERESRLSDVPGFQAFHLMKSSFDEESGTTLYATHTTWNGREDFYNWTKSEHFRQAHKNAGGNKHLYAGHPQFEGFEAVLSE